MNASIVDLFVADVGAELMRVTAKHCRLRCGCEAMQKKAEVFERMQKDFEEDRERIGEQFLFWKAKP